MLKINQLLLLSSLFVNCLVASDEYFYDTDDWDDPETPQMSHKMATTQQHNKHGTNKRHNSRRGRSKSVVYTKQVSPGHRSHHYIDHSDNTIQYPSSETILGPRIQNKQDCLPEIKDSLDDDSWQKDPFSLRIPEDKTMEYYINRICEQCPIFWQRNRMDLAVKVCGYLGGGIAIAGGILWGVSSTVPLIPTIAAYATLGLGGALGLASFVMSTIRYAQLPADRGVNVITTLARNAKSAVRNQINLLSQEGRYLREYGQQYERRFDQVQGMQQIANSNLTQATATRNAMMPVLHQGMNNGVNGLHPQ